MVNPKVPRYEHCKSLEAPDKKGVCMATKSIAKKYSLRDVINENVAPEAVDVFYQALNQGGTKVLSFWSLDNHTLNLEPLKRYHAGHLTYMLFLAKLLSSKKCVVQANICDSYSLKSIPKGKGSYFFNSSKSWRESRMRIRNFLDKAYLGHKEDVFAIFNLRDEFQTGNCYSQELHIKSKDIWQKTKRILSNYEVDFVDGRDYRYPRNFEDNDERIQAIHEILKKELWDNISIPETISLLFILSEPREWLSSKWTSKFIAYFANKYINNKKTEFILEGERGCYSWQFHLLLAKIVASEKVSDFSGIQIVPFLDTPNIQGDSFMEFKKDEDALFAKDILNASDSTNILKDFRENNKQETNRINELLASLDGTKSISSLIFNIVSKLSGYPLNRVQIIHASDIHFGNNFSFGSKASEAQWSPTTILPIYLSKKPIKERPHFLLISGDFTSICRESEFKQAEDFIENFIDGKALQPLPGKTKIVKHQIMAVPGNHDFAWDLQGGHQARNFKRFVTNTGVLSPWADTFDSEICEVIKPSNNIPLRIIYFKSLDIAIVLACSTKGTQVHDDDKEQYKIMRKGMKRLTDRQWEIMRKILNRDRPEFPPKYDKALNSCIKKLNMKKKGENIKLIFMSHHNASEVDHEANIPRGTKGIKKTLNGAKAMLWLHGHTHVPNLERTEEGLTICGAGTLGGWTAEGHSVNVINIGISNEYGNYISKLKFSMLEGDFQISDSDDN